MGKPTDYFIEFEDARRYRAELARKGGVAEAVDPSRTFSAVDARTLDEARRLARSVAVRRAAGVTTRFIYRRFDFEDVTPAELPPATNWRYETEFVEDIA